MWVILGKIITKLWIYICLLLSLLSLTVPIQSHSADSALWWFDFSTSISYLWPQVFSCLRHPSLIFCNHERLAEILGMVSFAVFWVVTTFKSYITFKYFIDTQYRLFDFYVLFVLWQERQKQDTVKDTRKDTAPQKAPQKTPYSNFQLL